MKKNYLLEELYILSKIDEYLGGLNHIYKNLNSIKAKDLLDDAIYKTKHYFYRQ